MGFHFKGELHVLHEYNLSLFAFAFFISSKLVFISFFSLIVDVPESCFLIKLIALVMLLCL